MSDTKNPWDDETPVLKKSKIVDFVEVKTTMNNPSSGGFGLELRVKWIVLALLVLWIISGFYQIQPNEQGVVLRFGAYNRTTDSGLHYHLPMPIETVEKVNMTQERSINLGVGDNNSSRNFIQSRSANSVEYNAFTDSHMLTGDENIVDINLTVVWIIKDAKDFLFKVRSPEQTIQVAAQSILREVVGQSNMQPIITGDRGKVEDDSKEELQKLLDSFESGIQIVRVKLQKADPPKQVVDAFNEVQRARADMERFKNEAEAYRNEILPKARGEAEQRLQNAQAYKESSINRAKGDAERFLSVYNAYKHGKEVTAKRLYLETMENVIAASSKVIIDPSSRGSNVLPLLPLNSKTPTAPASN